MEFDEFGSIDDVLEQYPILLPIGSISGDGQLLDIMVHLANHNIKFVFVMSGICFQSTEDLMVAQIML